MNRLTIVNWNYFYLKDLFNITRGTRLTKPDRVKGKTPLVTAGFDNHGISDYIANLEMVRHKNAITIDMFGYSFYRGYEFCCDDNILVLKNENMNRSIGLFIATVISKDNYRNSYGRQYRQKTFVNHKIKLPAKGDKPDWDYMEAFTDIHAHDYQYATKPATNLPTPKLDTTYWQYYELGMLFDVKYGVNLELVNLEETSPMDEGGIRLVSRTENSNGVSAFVKRQEIYKPNPANTISVAGGGSVLATFLQTNEYYSGRDIYYLQPKEKLNNSVLLFITCLIRREKYRFNYGRQANKSLKSLKIKLPSKNNGPDWNFMESFIQTLPFSSQL